MNGSERTVVSKSDLQRRCAALDRREARRGAAEAEATEVGAGPILKDQLAIRRRRHDAAVGPLDIPAGAGVDLGSARERPTSCDVVGDIDVARPISPRRADVPRIVGAGEDVPAGRIDVPERGAAARPEVDRIGPEVECGRGPDREAGGGPGAADLRLNGGGRAAPVGGETSVVRARAAPSPVQIEGLSAGSVLHRERIGGVGAKVRCTGGIEESGSTGIVNC